jgi:hypothetical protein
MPPRSQKLAVCGFTEGYWPNQVITGPGAVMNSAYRGAGWWHRPTGQIESWQGVAQVSSTNIGARLFAIDTQRGSVAGSSVGSSLVKYRGGALFFLADAASKQVYLDETALTGITTSATPYKLSVAIPNGGGYLLYEAGLTAPSQPTLAVSGTPGTKSMLGVYSIVLCKMRNATKAVGDPCAAVETASLVAGNQVDITFPAADTTQGQDYWVIGATATNEGKNGPWQVLDIVSEATVNAAGARTLTYEWRDGELGDEIALDNDVPPLASGIIAINDVLVLWGTGGSSDGAPGPEMRYSKPGKPESFPPNARVATTNHENMLNALAGEGRIYILTSNTLQVASLAGNSTLAIRPVWNFGFASGQAAVVCDQTLYGFTKSGPTRTRAQDDPDHEFAEPVLSDMKTWTASRVVVGVDPKNQAVVFFHHDGAGNATALAYMLVTGKWSAPMTFSGQVQSCATVNGLLYLDVLTGGNSRSYLFDSGGSSGNWYAVTPFLDCGLEGIDKCVTDWQVTGLADTARLFKAQDAIPDVTNTGAADGQVQTLAASSSHNSRFPVNVPFCKSFAMGVFGATASETVSEIAVWGYPQGVRR